MAGCYQCVKSPSVDPSGIGVCKKCSCLGCAYHGGYPGGNQSRFMCTVCLPHSYLLSAGGPPPSSGPPSGGSGPGGGLPVSSPLDDGGGAAPGSDDEPRFTSSLDWQGRMPQPAQASADARAGVDLHSLRRGLRTLFGLLDDEPDRQQFLTKAIETLREPVEDEVHRMAGSPNADEAFDERGGQQVVAQEEAELIIARYRSWLRTSLRPWMAEIHPILDEVTWLGEPTTPGGSIDILLAADAVGMNCWAWNMAVGTSPFSRLDVAGAMDPGLVVLTQLYAMHAPARVGAYAQ